MAHKKWLKEPLPISGLMSRKPRMKAELGKLKLHERIILRKISTALRKIKAKHLLELLSDQMLSAIQMVLCWKLSEKKTKRCAFQPHVTRWVSLHRTTQQSPTLYAVKYKK